MSNLWILDHITPPSPELQSTGRMTNIAHAVRFIVSQFNIPSRRMVDREIFREKLIQGWYGAEIWDQIMEEHILCFNMNMGGMGMAIYSIDGHKRLRVRQKWRVQDLASIDSSYFDLALIIYKDNPEFIFVR